MPRGNDTSDGRRTSKSLLTLDRAPCAEAAWESVGPDFIAGAIRQVVAVPVGGSDLWLYAVSANGGIWRLQSVSDYPDTRWEPLTDSELPVRFRRMAVGDGDERRFVYAATSLKTRVGRRITDCTSLLYRSTNHGGTWASEAIPDMGVVHKLLVDREDPEVVWAATSLGLWRRGATPGISLPSQAFWNRFYEGDCLDVAVDPDDSSVVYLGVRARGVYKSTNGGGSFGSAPILEYLPPTAHQTAPREQREAIKIALGRRRKNGASESPEDRTVVVRFGDEVCVSRSGGDLRAGIKQHWDRHVLRLLRPADDPDEKPVLDPEWDGSGLGGGHIRRSETLEREPNEWCNCLAVDPFDSDHFLLGSAWLFETRDGGASGHWTSPPAGHGDVNSVAFDPVTQGRVFNANDGGVFASTDGGASWGRMNHADTLPSGGPNVSRGLVASEFRHCAIRNGRVLATIDHTGFILKNTDRRWQFLLRNAEDAPTRLNHEHSWTFACPESDHRFYVINWVTDDDPQTTDDQGVRGRVAQFDLQVDPDDSEGLIAAPYSGNEDFDKWLFDDPVCYPAHGAYMPDDLVFNENQPGPFAVRVARRRVARRTRPKLGREILAATTGATLPGCTIRSLWIPRSSSSDWANQSEWSRRLEHTESWEAIYAISFVPGGGGSAYAVTARGRLLRRRGGRQRSPYTWEEVADWPDMPASDPFVSRVAVAGESRAYVVSQHAIGLYTSGDSKIETIHVSSSPDESFMSFAMHPSRAWTLFLGTNRGVYVSATYGRSWEPYQLELPAVPVTELIFDGSFLYAATFGRGLWRCRPCPVIGLLGPS